MFHTSTEFIEFLKILLLNAIPVQSAVHATPVPPQAFDIPPVPLQRTHTDRASFETGNYQEKY